MRLPLLLLFLSFGIRGAATDDDAEFYEYLYKSAAKARAQEAETARITREEHHEPVIEKNPPIRLPGDYQPLPGRTSYGDYWPLYPFSNQYHQSLTIDPSTSRHMGGDIIAPVPYWGLIDISGHFIERVHDYAHRLAYVNAPMNMLGLRKDQLVRLYTSQALAHNRGIQPKLPLAMLPKDNIPLNCAPPLCNPYVHTFAFGFEQDESSVTRTEKPGEGEHGGEGEGEGHGGEGEGEGGENGGHEGEGEDHGGHEGKKHKEAEPSHGEGHEGGGHEGEGEGEGGEHHNPLNDFFHVDGYEGQFDMAMPVGKGIAYRLPISGNIYFDRDNVSVAYGQHTGPFDPLVVLPGHYQNNLDVDGPRSFLDRARLPEFNEIVGSRRSKRAVHDVQVSLYDYNFNEQAVHSLYGQDALLQNGFIPYHLPLYHQPYVQPYAMGRRIRSKRAASTEMPPKEWEAMLADFETLPDGRTEEQKQEDEEEERKKAMRGSEVSPLASLLQNRVTPKGVQIEYLHTLQKVIGSQFRFEPKNDFLINAYRQQMHNLENVAEAWKDYKGMWGEDPYEEDQGGP